MYIYLPTEPPPLVVGSITNGGVTGGNTVRIQWPIPDILFLREYIITYSFLPYILPRGRRQANTVTVNTNETSLDIPDFSGGGTYTTDIDASVGAPGADLITLDVLPDDTTFTAPDRGGCSLLVCFPLLLCHSAICVMCVNSVLCDCPPTHTHIHTHTHSSQRSSSCDSVT